MSKARLSLLAVLIIAGLCLGRAARAFNLVAGGDFESPSLGGPGYLVVSSGNTVGPWLVGNDTSVGTGNNVTLEQFPALPGFFPWLTAHGGVQYLDLTGVANQPGSYIEQVIPTTQGSYYQLSYWAGSANSQWHTYPITITAILIDPQSSTVLATDNFTTTATPTVNQVIWEQRVLPSVQALSSQMRIRFLNSFSQQDACLMDDIGFEQVDAVPVEATTWGRLKQLVSE